MPCTPDDLSITEPESPSLSAIPGLGVPFSPKLPDNPFSIPNGFPESLLDIFNKLSMVLPSGIIKPGLSSSFGKNVFDGILSLMEKFFPFLMMYKFFLPALKLTICMLELICSLSNPFKMARAMIRLFRECIPEFLALFPIFALIIMIISLLTLFLEIIAYLISQVLSLVDLILKNINSLNKAINKSDEGGSLAIIKKIGMLLCGFQNLFSILSIVGVIIQVIKDILKLIFSIPPCDDGEDTDIEGCCTNDVCPRFIRNNETLSRKTGTLQYYPEVSIISASFPAPFNTSFSLNSRNQTHQFFDSSASTYDQFINISDAYDIPAPADESEKPVFFPTDVVFTAKTPSRQAPYVVDLRLPYNPIDWGRSPPPLNTVINTDRITSTTFTNGINTLSKPFINTNSISFQVVDVSNDEIIEQGNDGVLTSGKFFSESVNFKSIAGLTKYKLVMLDSVHPGNYGGFNIKSVTKGNNHEITLEKLTYNPNSLKTRFIRFKDCIVQYAPTRELIDFDGTDAEVNTGVLTLVGGFGTEDDGSALYGFEKDGVTQSTKNATLENFLFTKSISSASPTLSPTDGHTFTDVEYTFKIHHPVLLGKSLITLGCLPQVRLNKNFVNEVFAGGSGVKIALLNDLLNSQNGKVFPDIIALQNCLTIALEAFRNNVSQEGAAILQATMLACLDKTKEDTHAALKDIIGIGFDPTKSTFTLSPDVQFTGKSIKVQVQLNDRNGVSVTDNLPTEVNTNIASRIKGIYNFATISQFKYDGTRSFEATIDSQDGGNGLLQISFDNQVISEVLIPSNIDESPTNKVKELPYSFVYVPVVRVGESIVTGTGDVDGAPRRNESDVSKDKGE